MEQFFGEFTAAVVSCSKVYFKQRIHHYNYKIIHAYRLSIKIWTICRLGKVIKSANFEIGFRIKFALNRQSATLCGGPPTFIWPWEGSNYPSRSCNGPNGPKGPKFKQNKNKQHGGMRRNQIQCKQWESMEIISRIYICQDNEKKKHCWC